jgi:hypothetical protein
VEAGRTPGECLIKADLQNPHAPERHDRELGRSDIPCNVQERHPELSARRDPGCILPKELPKVPPRGQAGAAATLPAPTLDTRQGIQQSIHGPEVW